MKSLEGNERQSQQNTQPALIPQENLIVVQTIRPILRIPQRSRDASPNIEVQTVAFEWDLTVAWNFDFTEGDLR